MNFVFGKVIYNYLGVNKIKIEFNFENNFQSEGRSRNVEIFLKTLDVFLDGNSDICPTSVLKPAIRISAKLMNVLLMQ